MRVCPRCLTRYADDSRFCDLDGALLELAEDSLGIDVAFSDETSAESPSGRRQNDFLGDVPAPLPGTTTIIDGGTRLSVSDTPSSLPARPPPKKQSRTRTLAEMRVGQLLGSYRLQEVLGTGGMGAVYRAEHIKLGRQVALKLLHPQFAKRRDALARFFQEAQAVNRIRHKNIVDVTDLVELEDGTAFIIMELLDGISLGEYLKTVGLLDSASATSVLIQICDALAAAHHADIVHRDLKPDNIFLSRTDEGDLLVKLLDFGVAKLINPETEVGHRTAAGSVVGTPAFMSPEQAAGLEIDQRSDIYSLGAIMYQLFSGQPVFSGKSFSELVNKHLSVEPTSLLDTPGGLRLDRDINEIVMRCLQKSPEARFQTAYDLRRALVAYLNKIAADRGTEVETASGIYRLTGGQPTYDPPPAVLSGPLDAQVLDTAMVAGDLDPNWRTSSRGGSRLPLYVAVGVALTATLVAIGVVSEGRDREPRPAPAPEPSTETTAGAEAEPIVTPAPVITPMKGKMVDVRISSVPPAQVFARGSTIPKCESTPCKITIDPRDGGSPKRRQFVLRAGGFEDATIEVLLDRPKPEYRAELVALVTPEETEEPEPSSRKSERKNRGKRRGKRENESSQKSGDSGKTSAKKPPPEKKTDKTDKTPRDTKKTKTGPVSPDQVLDPFSKRR